MPRLREKWSVCRPPSNRSGSFSSDSCRLCCCYGLIYRVIWVHTNAAHSSLHSLARRCHSIRHYRRYRLFSEKKPEPNSDQPIKCLYEWPKGAQRPQPNNYLLWMSLLPLASQCSAYVLYRDMQLECKYCGIRECNAGMCFRLCGHVSA